MNYKRWVTPYRNVSAMARKLPIPEEMRWRIAATLSAKIPVTYGMVFRESTGADYDRLEQQIWVALAHEAKAVAWTCSLPVADSRDLTLTLDILNTLLFGPEFKSEQISFENDRSVLLVRKCPFLLREQEMSGPPSDVFNRCLAFSIALIEELNPEYTLRFVRAMCQGDRNCEMKVVLRKDTEEEEKMG